MKLNTLLLTSAATLMATSVAFAADLPSKKAAPSAGSVQICKVGGMTGFTLPGSDTCLGISGLIRYNASYQDVFPVTKLDTQAGVNVWDLPDDSDGRRDWHQGATYRINVDARTNTEVGVVRSFIRLTDGTFDKAYIQFSGLTVGVKDSLADIVGTDSNNSGTGFEQSSTGIDYQLSAGGLTFGIGAETSLDRNIEDGVAAGTFASSLVLSDRPDLIASLSGTSGPIGFAVAGVSHQAVDPFTGEDHQGYAVIGRINAKFGDLGARIWGAWSDGASAYTGNYSTTQTTPGTTFAATGSVSGMPDFDGTRDETAEGTAFGGELSIGLGKATTVYLLARQNELSLGNWDVSERQYGAQISHTIAKGLSIQPEVYYTEGTVDNLGHSALAANDLDYENMVYALRIQRDF